MKCPINPLKACCGDNKADYQHAPTRELETYVDTRERDRLRHTTPQPHFNPGYTGYTHGSVDNMTGITYGYFTKAALTKHPVAGNRLSHIPGDFIIPIVKNPERRPEDNPHTTLEPRFVPGYTGFTPGSGIRRSEGFGETYGRMTHIDLAKHFLRGSRLRPIHDYPREYALNEEDVKFYCYQHELTRDDIRRRAGLVPGYAGHVPRARFRHGKNGTTIATESIAEFQKILNNLTE